MTSFPSDTKSWLAKLVSFNTVSVNSNLPMLDYIRDYLKTFGIECEYVYNPEKTHANLWATLPGEGGVTEGGIILSGHTDVVPVDGQKWNSDPFVMTERNGKLYGRGTSDMKGFIAICMFLVPTFMQMKRAKPVHFAFSFDEERGCAGVPYLADYLKKKNFKADYCLVGDGWYEVVTGNKGLKSWVVTVKGKAIHSSMALMNTSCNAIEYAAMIIAKIREIAIDLREHGDRDNHYSCPFSPISTGLIKGGNAVNTVPAECTFTYSVRMVATEVAEKIEKEVQAYVDTVILPAMRKEYPEASVEIAPEWFLPSYSANEDHPYIKMVREMMNDHKVRKLPGGTEAGFFQDSLGIPTVNVGPGGSKAHLANEYTTPELLQKSQTFTLELVKRCTTGNTMAKL